MLGIQLCFKILLLDFVALFHNLHFSLFSILFFSSVQSSWRF